MVSCALEVDFNNMRYINLHFTLLTLLYNVFRVRHCPASRNLVARKAKRGRPDGYFSTAAEAGWLKVDERTEATTSRDGCCLRGIRFLTAAAAVSDAARHGSADR